MLKATTLLAALAGAAFGRFDMPRRMTISFGPASKGPSIHALHRGIGTSKYMPHQGARERERRAK